MIMCSFVSSIKRLRQKIYRKDIVTDGFLMLSTTAPPPNLSYIGGREGILDFTEDEASDDELEFEWLNNNFNNFLC